MRWSTGVDAPAIMLAPLQGLALSTSFVSDSNSMLESLSRRRIADFPLPSLPIAPLR